MAKSANLGETVSSGSALFGKVSLLVCRDEKVQALITFAADDNFDFLNAEIWLDISCESSV